MLNSSDQEKPLKQPEKKNLKNVLYRRTNLRLIVVFLLETTIIYHVTATGLAKVKSLKLASTRCDMIWNIIMWNKGNSNSASGYELVQPLQNIIWHYLIKLNICNHVIVTVKICCIQSMGPQFANPWNKIKEYFEYLRNGWSFSLILV